MNAKEMFDKLGYKVEREDEKYIAYVKNDILVVFNKERKTHYSYEDYHDNKLVVFNTISTHQAIHQQMKELGWIE